MGNLDEETLQILRQKEILVWFIAITLAVVISCVGLAQQSGLDLQEKLDEYSEYDYDGDGINEIESLTLLPFDESKPNMLSTEAPIDVVIVLVEDRLLQQLLEEALPTEELIGCLKVLQADLVAEGYESRFISAGLYDGPIHQDGKTLLALREFLRALWSGLYGNLRGVLLVGSFPEAIIARRWIWHRQWDPGETFVIEGMDVSDKYFPPKEILRIPKEFIAHRADIVLADLDGNWEDLYHQEPMEFREFQAVVDQLLQGTWWKTNVFFRSTLHGSIGPPKSFEDFFYINDANWSLMPESGSYGEATPTTPVTIATNEPANPELAPLDHTSPNPIAMPEIIVSRINARHIAVNPHRDFLTDKGEPQQLRDVSKVSTVNYCFWRHDPALERELLIDYFQRNHAFRTDYYAPPVFGASGIACKGMSATQAVVDICVANYPTFKLPLSKLDADLVSYVKWLGIPSRVRWIDAHAHRISTMFGPMFGPSYDEDELEMITGGSPWRWEEKYGRMAIVVPSVPFGTVFGGGANQPCTGPYCNCAPWAPDGPGNLAYVPTLDGLEGKANFHLYRTLWENGAVLSEGDDYLLVHKGCEANSPYGAEYYPYSDYRYGAFQNLESMLFYAKALGIMARAKIYFDAPEGFGEALYATPGACFGDAWIREFSEIAANANLNNPKYVDGNKRAYWWSLLGDWTLPAKY